MTPPSRNPAATSITITTQALRNFYIIIDTGQIAMTSTESHNPHDLNTLIILDGLPIVGQASRPQLIRFLLRKLNDVSPVADQSKIYMPVDQQQMTLGQAGFSLRLM